MYALEKIPSIDISINTEQGSLTLDQHDYLKEIVNRYVDESRKIAVIMLDDVQEANAAMKIMNKKVKELDMYRQIFTKRLDERKSEIMDTFRRLADPLEKEVKRLKGDLLEFEKREREKQEAELQRELEEARQKALQQGIPDAEFVQVEVVTTKKSITGVTTTTKKTWKVTDFDLIPREYLMVDEKRINQLRSQYDVKDKSPVPGIEFGSELSVRG